MPQKRVSLHPIDDAIRAVVKKLKKLKPSASAAGKKKIAKEIESLRKIELDLISVCKIQPSIPPPPPLPHFLLFIVAAKKNTRPKRRRSRN